MSALWPALLFAANGAPPPISNPVLLEFNPKVGTVSKYNLEIAINITNADPVQTTIPAEFTVRKQLPSGLLVTNTTIIKGKEESNIFGRRMGSVVAGNRALDPLTLAGSKAVGSAFGIIFSDQPVTVGDTWGADFSPKELMDSLLATGVGGGIKEPPVWNGSGHRSFRLDSLTNQFAEISGVVDFEGWGEVPVEGESGTLRLSLHVDSYVKFNRVTKMPHAYTTAVNLKIQPPKGERLMIEISARATPR